MWCDQAVLIRWHYLKIHSPAQPPETVGVRTAWRDPMSGPGWADGIWQLYTLLVMLVPVITCSHVKEEGVSVNACFVDGDCKMACLGLWLHLFRFFVPVRLVLRSLTFYSVKARQSLINKIKLFIKRNVENLWNCKAVIDATVLSGRREFSTHSLTLLHFHFCVGWLVSLLFWHLNRTVWRKIRIQIALWDLHIQLW